MMKQPEERKGPGLAGITPAHRMAWESRAASYRSIGEELGVRKQSVNDYAKRNGWSRSKTAAPPPPPPPAPPTSPPIRFPAEDPDVESVRVHLALVQANRAILVRCLEAIQAKPDVIGCQRVQATLRSVREELTALGFLLPADALEGPKVLTIRVMTDEEEAAVQRRAEGESGFGDGDSRNVVPFARPRRSEPDEPKPRGGKAGAERAPPASKGGAGNSSGQGVHANPTNRAGNSEVAREGAPPPAWKLPTGINLPAADGFRDWLDRFAAQYGEVTLRELVLALGGQTTARGDPSSRNYLIAQVLTLTRAEPSALIPLIADAAA